MDDDLAGPPTKRPKIFEAPVFVSAGSTIGQLQRVEDVMLRRSDLTTYIPFQPSQFSNLPCAIIHNDAAETQNVHDDYSVTNTDTTKRPQPLFSFQETLPSVTSSNASLELGGTPVLTLPRNLNVSIDGTLTTNVLNGFIVCSGINSTPGTGEIGNSMSLQHSINLSDIPGTVEIGNTMLPESNDSLGLANNLILLPAPTATEYPCSGEQFQFQSGGNLILLSVPIVTENHNSSEQLLFQSHLFPSTESQGLFVNGTHLTEAVHPTETSVRYPGNLITSHQNVEAPEVSQQKQESDNVHDVIKPSVLAPLCDSTQGPSISANGQQTVDTTAHHVGPDSSSSTFVQLIPNVQNLPQHDSTNTANVHSMPNCTAEPAGESAEKKLLRQYGQQLVSLLHADNCQMRQKRANGKEDKCLLPDCQSMKYLLAHMVACQDGKNCSFPLCLSSRQILSHWRDCARTDCPICLSVKRYSSIRHYQDSIATQKAQSNPRATSSDTDRTCASLSIPYNAEHSTGLNEVTGRDQNMLAPLNVFTPDELRKALMPTLQKLYDHEPESIPFKQPMDSDVKSRVIHPYGSGKVKKPIDLSILKQKFESDQYHDPWQYIEDVHLMFNNVRLCNRKKSPIYRYCTKLAEVFEREIDPVMRSLGYCCGRKYIFQTQVLHCYGRELCVIPRNAKYWSYRSKIVKSYGLFNERYTYCQRCFSEIPGDTVVFGGNPSYPQIIIEKEMFVETSNDDVEHEPFVVCNVCGREFHKICVLHFDAIWPRGFICVRCLESKGLKRKENKFTAKLLPQTKLGSYVENRVNAFLKDKACDATVTVRVVSSSDKFFAVKSGMRNRYVNDGEWPDSFPYRAKALFAFEEIDGVDVCFFGMQIQEYGSQCAKPNSRRIYIAYLDSVNFFQPKDLRTGVYHEIILGCLRYAKQLGYTTAHVWSGPPDEGEDYIFYCHPSDQKFPSPKRLREWYKILFAKGITDGTVCEYKDILKQAVEDNLTSASQLPYFEGDFWPDFLEESIRKEEKEKANAQVIPPSSDVNADCEEALRDSGTAKRKNKPKRGRSKNSNKNKSGAPLTGNDLSAKIYSTMERHKDDFFVIRLHSDQDEANLPETVDPDPLINCEMMDGRYNFLSLSRERCYEFSSLRRAKYSTMAMLFALHNQEQQFFASVCNNCKTRQETWYHCSVCDSFDLCLKCFDKEGHSHKMEKLAFGVDNLCSPGNQKYSTQEYRRLSVQRSIRALIHACQCQDVECASSSCKKMKRVMQHNKICKKNTNGWCSVCVPFIILCSYHAKVCEDAKCPVLYCLSIKEMLRQKKLKQCLQEEQSLKRRIATMKNNDSDSPVSHQSPGNSEDSVAK